MAEGGTRRRRTTAPPTSSRAAQKRVRRDALEGPGLVWAEVGATIAITDDPPQFVRFAFGAEMSTMMDTESYEATRKALMLRLEEGLNRSAEHFKRIALEAGE